MSSVTRPAHLPLQLANLQLGQTASFWRGAEDTDAYPSNWRRQ